MIIFSRKRFKTLEPSDWLRDCDYSHKAPLLNVEIIVFETAEVIVIESLN